MDTDSCGSAPIRCDGSAAGIASDAGVGGGGGGDGVVERFPAGFWEYRRLNLGGGGRVKTFNLLVGLALRVMLFGAGEAEGFVEPVVGAEDAAALSEGHALGLVLGDPEELVD